MEDNFEQCEALLGSASEAAEACLDMEGGTLVKLTPMVGISRVRMPGGY